MLNKILISLIAFVIYFSTPTSTFTDPRDKVEYDLLIDDELIWFKENLKYHTSNALCYDDQLENCKKLGRLYNYEEALNACPKGWRLPTISEWNSFYKKHAEDGIFSFMNNSDSLWINNHMNTNSSGFNAIPAGMKSRDRYGELGIAANFWTSDPKSNHADHFHIYGIHEDSARMYPKAFKKIPKKARKLSNLPNAWLLENKDKHFIIMEEDKHLVFYYSHTPHHHWDWKDRYMSVRCVCENM